jgi:type IV pilus assembly protein PilE
MKKKHVQNLKQLKAFTLTEIMVVLVIIGVLTLIALPNMAGLFGRAYAVEAKTQLKYIANLQESYQQVNFKYALDFPAIGFEAPKTVLQEGDAKYTYEITNASPAGFIAKATAVADFDGDGVFNVWQVNQDGKIEQIVAD